jgi:hypothetical protein
LSEGWLPGDAGEAFARNLDLDCPHVLAKFRAHFLAKPGKGALKANWDMAWQAWCLEEHERIQRGKDPQVRATQPPTGKLDWVIDMKQRMAGGMELASGPVVEHEPT